MFCIWSALWFWSATLTARPEAIIGEWEQTSVENIDNAVALKMIEILKQSLSINPLDAKTHLLLAEFYEILAKNDADEYSKKAEIALLLAVKHQPSWDYGWAKLANFYSNQAVLNKADFIHALSKAMLFGPYELDTQKLILPLLFEHWDLLQNNKRIHAQVENIITHALQYYLNAHFTLSLAKKYKRFTEIEPLLTHKWQEKRLKQYLKEAAND